MKQLQKVMLGFMAAILLVGVIPPRTAEASNVWSAIKNLFKKDASTSSNVTLKAYQWALDNQSTDFKNLWYYKELENETGVSIDWTVIKESDWKTQVNLALVSGDYPDLFIRPDRGLNIEEYGVTQKIFVPLNEYLPTYMPNYFQRLQYNNVTDTMYASDGNMYFIGYLIAQNINHNAHYFINKTWLDAVGQKVPTTVDELTKVLTAFRDKKPGASGMVPMSGGGEIYHQTEGIYNYFAMFGVPLQRWVYANITDSGKVVFPGDMPGFRDALEWLSKCYADGLLDKDALTQSENDWNAKVNANQVGFATYLRLINSAWTNPDTIKNWVSITPPASKYGAKLPRELEIPEYGAVLTTANKHIPETLKWLDKQFDTEWMMVAANGPSRPGAPIDPTIQLNKGVWSIKYIPENNGLYNYVPVTQGQFFAPGDYYFSIYELPPHRVERKEYAKEYEAAGVVEKNSYMNLTKFVRPTPKEATELERQFEAIHTFMQEKIADFIMNGVTDAKWKAFQNEAKKVGVDSYIKTYQKLYDAYLTSKK